MSPWRELFLTTWQNLKADTCRVTVAVLCFVVDTCTRWLLWLDPPHAPPPDAPELQAARLLTVQWENLLGPGYGDAKRRQVFAALQKQFPELRKRAISQAIEDALP